MASIRVKCVICEHDFDVHQDASSLDDSTHAKICDPCSSALEEGTFCLQFHKHDDGWEQCGVCRKELHSGCILALNTCDVSEVYGIICNECVQKQSLPASNMNASSSIALPVNCSQMNASNGSSENFTEEQLPTDSSFAAVIDDSPDLGNAAPERRLNTSQRPSSDLTLLLEKTLTATDCNVKDGRLLIPRTFAEKYLPELTEKHKVPFEIKDTKGKTWNFKLRWWNHKNSRRYVIDGIRSCLRKKEWVIGDTLKFYRQLPNGNLLMEHVKGNASTSAR